MGIGFVVFILGMTAGYWLKCVTDNWRRMKEREHRNR